MKIVLKKILSFIAYKSGTIYYRQSHLFSQKKKTCLMYHRVLPEGPTFNCEPGMYVTSDVFEMHLKLLAENYCLCKLEDIFQIEFRDRFGQKNKPVCCLTFDDGWVDFYQIVFPLLKKFAIPATVFLPTAFIGGNKLFWTDRLLNMIHFAVNHPMLSPENISFSSTVGKQLFDFVCAGPQKINNAIEFMKPYPTEVITATLDEIELFLTQESTSPEKRMFLNWEEVREMKDSGFVKFGSHTHNHCILTTLKKSEIQYELNTSLQILEAQGAVDKGFIPFCYPNGNTNDNIAQMVKDAGFHLAVTTQKGWVKSNDDMFNLKRVGIHNDISYTPSLFLARAVGLF